MPRRERPSGAGLDSSARRVDAQEAGAVSAEAKLSRVVQGRKLSLLVAVDLSPASRIAMDAAGGLRHVLTRKVAGGLVQSE